MKAMAVAEDTPAAAACSHRHFFGRSSPAPDAHAQAVVTFLSVQPFTSVAHRYMTAFTPLPRRLPLALVATLIGLSHEPILKRRRRLSALFFTVVLIVIILSLARLSSFTGELRLLGLLSRRRLLLRAVLGRRSRFHDHLRTSPAGSASCSPATATRRAACWCGRLNASRAFHRADFTGCIL